MLSEAAGDCLTMHYVNSNINLETSSGSPTDIFQIFKCSSVSSE